MDPEADDLYSGYGEETVNDGSYGLGQRTSSFERLATSGSATIFANPRIGTSVSRVSTSSRPSSSWQDRSASASRAGTASRPMTSRIETMASRPGDNLTTDRAPGFNRPMTSITSAGYRPGSSRPSTFRPGTSKSTSTLSEIISLDPEETPIMKLRKLKIEINQMVDMSDSLLSEGEKEKALEMGKNASEKEKELVKFEIESETFHDWDVTFVVIYNLGKIYEDMELYEDALESYTSLLIEKFTLQEGEVRFCIGNIYFKQEKYVDAIKAFRSTLDKIGDSNNRLRTKLLLQCGIAFVRMNKPEEAVVCFESIMVLRPNIQAAFLLVMANCIEKEYKAARTSFLLLLDVPIPMKPQNQTDDPTIDELTDLLNSDPLAQYEKELVDYAEKCVLTAGRCIAPYIEITECDGYDWVLKTLRRSNYAYLAPGLEVSHSLVLLKNGKHHEAIKSLEKVANHSTRFLTLAATNLCHLHLLRGDIKKAMKCGKIAVFGNHGDSYNADGFINLGNCYFVEGNMEEALKLYKQGLLLDSTNINGLYNMGLLSQKCGQFKEALNWFYKVLKQVPTFGDVIFQIGTTLAMKNDLARSFQWYNKALVQCPNDPEILYRLGLSCDANGDMRQAYQYFYDSFRSNPTDLDVVKWLLNYFSSYQIRPDEAEKYFSQGIRLQPENSYWPKTLAISYKRVGDVDRALDILRKAHNDFPMDREILEQLTKMSGGMDEYEAAYYETKLEALINSMPDQSTPPNTSIHEKRQNLSNNQVVPFSSENVIPMSVRSNTPKHQRHSQTKYLTPRFPQNLDSTEAEGEEDELEQFFENVDVSVLLNVEKNPESN